MNPATLLAILTVVIAVPLNWLVTVLLWRVWRRNRDVPVLRERAIAALAVAIIVTVFGLIFLNNDATVPPLSPDVTRIVTRATVLAASVVPSLYWLLLYGSQSPPDGDG